MAVQDGTPVPEMGRRRGFIGGSFYTWRRKYGGRSVNVSKRDAVAARRHRNQRRKDHHATL